MSMPHPLNMMADSGFFFPTSFNGAPVQYQPGSAGALATGQGGAQGGGGGGAPAGSGQFARFTPDPTVNGPWTHTRADIPLFRQPPAAQPQMSQPPAAPRPPTAPAQPPAPRPQMTSQPQRPAMQQRPSMDWSSLAPWGRGGSQQWGGAAAAQPQRRTSYKDMLADALSRR